MLSTTDTISNDAADVSNNSDSITESTGVDEDTGKTSRVRPLRFQTVRKALSRLIPGVFQNRLSLVLSIVLLEKPVIELWLD